VQDTGRMFFLFFFSLAGVLHGHKDWFGMIHDSCIPPLLGDRWPSICVVFTCLTLVAFAWIASNNHYKKRVCDVLLVVMSGLRDA
jgi:hypothetical protein